MSDLKSKWVSIVSFYTTPKGIILVTCAVFLGIYLFHKIQDKFYEKKLAEERYKEYKMKYSDRKKYKIYDSPEDRKLKDEILRWQEEYKEREKKSASLNITNNTYNKHDKSNIELNNPTKKSSHQILNKKDDSNFDDLQENKKYFNSDEKLNEEYGISSVSYADYSTKNVAMEFMKRDMDRGFMEDSLELGMKACEDTISESERATIPYESGEEMDNDLNNDCGTGFNDAFDDGFNNGFDDGFNNGFDDGINNDFNNGFNDPFPPMSGF